MFISVYGIYSQIKQQGTQTPTTIFWYSEINKLLSFHSLMWNHNLYNNLRGHQVKKRKTPIHANVNMKNLWLSILVQHFFFVNMTITHPWHCGSGVWL